MAVGYRTLFKNSVVEDFHETVVESAIDRLSVCSVASDSTESSMRATNQYVASISNLKETLPNDHLEAIINVDSQIFDDRCHSEPLTDTFSINSVEIDSSGSSLSQFESTFESDVVLHDVTSSNPEYSIAEDYPMDNEELVTGFSSNNTAKVAELNSDQNALQDIKAAIKVKWMDRSVFIQKSIQQHNQDSYGEFVSNLDLQKCLVFQSTIDTSENEFSKLENKTKKSIENSIETMHMASKSFQKMVTQEIDGFLKSIQYICIIPDMVEITQNNSLKLFKPITCISRTVFFKNDPRSYFYNLIQNFEDKLDTNANCTTTSCSKPIDLKSELDDDDVDDSHSDTIVRLQTDVHKKDVMLKTVQANLSNALMTNERLRGSTGNLEESLNLSKTELHRCKSYIAKLEENCQVLNETNQSLLHLKQDMENVIASEKQQKVALQMKVDSLSYMENEYTWLRKMYDDYQALCIDYDNAKLKCTELENQLYEANGAIESYKMNLGMLQEKVAFYHSKMEELKHFSHGGGHCHEPKCSCENYRRETSCFHSKPKKKHKKHREKSRSRDYNNSYPLSQYSNGYSEDYRYDDAQRKAAVLPRPLDAKELDARYDQLQMTKRALESELCHVPSSNISARHGSRNTDQIENELDQVDLELSSIRRQLKQLENKENISWNLRRY